VISRYVLIVSALLSTFLLAWALVAEEWIYPAIALALLGIAWTLAQFKWRWVSSLGFALITLLVILGVIFNLSALLLASAEVSAFIAWDLAEFFNRVRQASPKDDIGKLEQKHFTRLGLVLVAGVGSALLVRLVKVRFSFEVGALLVLAGIWGVSILVGRMRRNE
jgi:hypothetical protein